MPPEVCVHARNPSSSDSETPMPPIRPTPGRATSGFPRRSTHITCRCEPDSPRRYTMGPAAETDSAARPAMGPMVMS